MTFAGRTVASAVVGGTASVIGGGKFANGAQTGAFVYAFNHALHDREGTVKPEEVMSELGFDPNGPSEIQAAFMNPIDAIRQGIS